jgi:hypothetical protein
MNESVNQEPESFIVQNVTLGPHYVSDIRLNFGPLQAIDLTWEDPKVVKASKDLRNSLRLGLLRKITPDQFDSIEERAAVKGKKELLKQQSNNNLRTVDIDGKTIEAESIDAEKAYSNKNNVTTAGYANDSLSYAMALDIAQTQAELQGEDLSVEQFAERVQRNPGIINQLLAQQKNLDANSSVSGVETRGRAFVAEPPGDATRGSSVREVEMTNYNRDRRVAGADFNYLDTPEDDGYDAIADAIDLEADMGEGEEGSIRRV